MKKTTFREKVGTIYQSKYRVRILAGLFLIAVLAIGITETVVFREVSFWVEEDNRKDEESILSNLNSIYENQVTGYQEQAQLLNLDYNIQSFLLSGGRLGDEAEVYRTIKSFITNRPEIFSVFLFSENEILASYDTRTVSGETKKAAIEIIRTETRTDKEVLYMRPNERAYKNQMFVFRSDREYLYGPGSCGVVLAVDVDYIQKQVLPKNREVKSSFYILHKNGEPVAMQKDDYEEVLPEIYQRIIDNNTVYGMWEEEIAGEKRKISYINEETGQYMTILIQDISKSQIEIRRAERVLLLSTIIAIGAVIITAWLLSGWLYDPVSRVFQNIQNIAGIMDNGEKQNELSTVFHCLTDIKQKIQNDSVLRFLRYGREGYISEAGVPDFGSDTCSEYTVIVFRYHLEREEQRELFFQAIKENMETIFGENRTEVYCYLVSPNEIVVILGQEQQVSVEKKELECLLTELERLYGICGCMGIACCAKADKIPKAYRKAVLLTGYYVLSKQNKVMDEYFLCEKSTAMIHERERDNILSYVRADKELEIKTCIDRLLDYLSGYHIKVANKYLNEVLMEVLQIYKGSLENKNEMFDDIFLDNFLESEVFIGDIDLRQWICQLIVQVRNQVSINRKSPNVQIMEKIVRYLDENFQDAGISVESVAEIHGLSVSYFSKLFNCYTGKTFPDYICQLRLQKGNQMLLEWPNMSITEIAGNVGFNSSSYFTAVYRKYYGMSPTQMRRKKTGEQNSENR